jgi:P-type Cu2+ transporter
MNNHNHAHNHGSMKSYTCPMHPEIKQDMPGICPECGMNLIAISNSRQETIKKGDGYDKHAGHSTEIFLKKFWVNLALSVPVVAYSSILYQLFGWRAPAFFGSGYIPAVLGSIVFFYGGWIFLTGAWRELKARLPGMMTLIALAISTAYLYSIFAILSGRSDTLFWELSTLITIMLLGHYVEMRAVSGAQGALQALSKLIPDTAEVMRGSKSEIVPVGQLREGDTIFVRPGGRIPADGIVAEGRSEVNESMITGESQPVIKNTASEVIAGTINGNGALKIKVNKIGEHTFLAGVMRLVREAQYSKSRLQILSDRAAYLLNITAVLTGGLTFLLWLLASRAGFSFALERAVAVLVIACPHALGLAVPLVAAISTTMAAQRGFLVRQRLALELARKVGAVLFDKTGTLTRGEYGITDVWKIGAKNEEELLQLAASVDAHSEHFISKAIVNKAKEKGISILEVKNFSRIPGKGARGAVEENEILVGGRALADEIGIIPPPDLKERIEAESRNGKTIIYVFSGKSLLGVFGLADVIRDESRQAVKELKNSGIKVAMVTGDSAEVASWVAGKLGIDEYFAEVLPEDKVGKVKLLQSRGIIVAMVGDGINDAPALTQADVGIAIGAGTNVAIESAGIILVRNDPRDIVKIVKLSGLTYNKMVQNILWAAGYNIVAIPLAAGVLSYKGIFLQPALAAVFMSLSTVIVAINAVLMRRKRI